jgi:hypothetical protein
MEQTQLHRREEFVLWDVKIDGKRYRTAATHALLQKGWKILARFVDCKIRRKNGGAIVAEAAYERGMFSGRRYSHHKLYGGRK